MDIPTAAAEARGPKHSLHAPKQSLGAERLCTPSRPECTQL